MKEISVLIALLALVVIAYHHSERQANVQVPNDSSQPVRIRIDSMEQMDRLLKIGGYCWRVAGTYYCEK